MILTGSEIIKEVRAGNIHIEPFSLSQVNPNSYNYRLGKELKVYKFFDGKRSNFECINIPESGYVLKPRQTYLGSTSEIIGSNSYAMSLIGRSSMGRCGLFLQISANLGHTNSDHCWTLELVAALPIRVYPNMIIGQVSFWDNDGEVDPYCGKYGRYSKPKETILWD